MFKFQNANCGALYLLPCRKPPLERQRRRRSQTRSHSPKSRKDRQFCYALLYEGSRCILVLWKLLQESKKEADRQDPNTCTPRQKFTIRNSTLRHICLDSWTYTCTCYIHYILIHTIINLTHYNVYLFKFIYYMHILTLHYITLHYIQTYIHTHTYITLHYLT